MEPSEGDDILIDHLIAELRIICNHRIVKSGSDWDPTSYRILQEPIDESIIADLMGGPWTVPELAEKYGIERNDIDDILHMLIKHQDLLEIGYLARRVGWDERPGHKTYVRYTVRPVPFEARIYDLFFGCSLLDWHSNILSEIDIVPTDTGEFTSILQNLCEIWQMPLTKVLDSLEERDALCVQSIFGPLLFSKDCKIYENIRHSLDEDPELLKYSYFRLDFQNFINDYRALNRRHIELMSIFDIQRCVIRLHDAIAYCSHFDDARILKKLLTQKRRLFNLFFSKPTQHR